MNSKYTFSKCYTNTHSHTWRNSDSQMHQPNLSVTE